MPLPTDPAEEPLPHSCMLDLGNSLPTNTADGGFLQVGDDGHFYHPDGTRARFFGVNIAKDGVFVDWHIIDRAVDVLAKAGVNLVRFHHLDGPDGILGRDRFGRGEYFDKANLRTLDYWIDRLGSRGIRVYIDLLDFREFSEREGVRHGPQLGRGAKPYAIFVPEIIELQKDFATRLLREHINPFTGLAYADDPTICLIELFDENGLFIRNGDLPELVSPYREMLAKRWNDWLGKRYGSTERLRRAWTNALGDSALKPAERLEAGSVALPLVPQTRPESSVEFPQRRVDASEFLYELHVEYYTSMREHLRKVGVKQPLGAVGSLDRLPDIAAIAQCLDFVGTNFYWDHPAWQAGRDWQEPFFYSDLPALKDEGRYSLAASVALAKVRGTPLVIREWSYCWPNATRATGMVEMAAFCALQDIDAAIAFTYQPADSVGRLGFFDMHNDPARWGLFALLGQVIQRGAIAPARTDIAFAHSRRGALAAGNNTSVLYRAAWVSRISNVFFADRYEAEADWTVLAGPAEGSALRGEGLILREPMHALTSAGIEEEPAWLSGYRIPAAEPPTGPLAFDGLINSAPSADYAQARLFDLSALTRAGHTPLGVSERDGVALGLHDPTRRSYAFRELSDGDTLRLLLDVIDAPEGVPLSHESVNSGAYVSDTGEIIRDASAGLLIVRAPTVRMVAAADASTLAVRAGELSMRSRSDTGALVALSLDGAPLEASRHYIIKMVTLAQNDRQREARVERGPKPFVIRSFGQAPLRTMGRPDAVPTRLLLSDQPLITVYQRNGSWELLRQGDAFCFVTDTEGARVSIAGLPEADCSAYAPVHIDLNSPAAEARDSEAGAGNIGRPGAVAP